MSKIQELREKKVADYAAIKELADRADKWTDEDRSNWNKVNAAYDETCKSIDAEMESARSSEAIQKRLAEIEERNKAERNDKRVGFDAGERRLDNPENVEARAKEDAALALQAWGMRANRHHSSLSGRELSKRHKEACERLAIDINSEVLDVSLPATRFTAAPSWSSLNGQQLTRESRADAPMYIGGSNVGSQLIPQGFVYEFEKKMVAYDGPRAVARILSTSEGNSLPWPTIDDTSNSGALLSENTTMSDAVAATTGAITFSAYKYESKPIQVSAELFQDNAFDLASLVGELLGERIGRAQGLAHTTGTGSSQPKGIVTCATAGVTAASATAIAPDELLALVHQLDPAYRRANPNVGFMMHDSILLYLRKLKDGDGQYLWQPGLQNGVPDRLVGYPVAINQNMQSSVATGTVTILFADFSKFIIRDAGTVRLYRLEELYRAKDLTGFCAFHRTDSNTIATTAIRKLTQA